MADASGYGACGCARARGGSVEALVAGLAGAMEHERAAEMTAAARGLLQGLDPRAKLSAMACLIASVTLVHDLAALAGLFLLAVMLGMVSAIGPGRLARQVWAGVLLFTGLIALPALVLVPGPVVAALPGTGWGITRPGLVSAGLLVGRAETAATLALLLVLTTPWPHLLKSLRWFGVPMPVVAVLGMTHRFIFLLLQTALDLFEARRARLLSQPTRAERARLAVQAMAALLTRTLSLAGEVHMAMVARGYRGEVRLIDDFQSGPRDWLAAGLAGLVLGASLTLA